MRKVINILLVFYWLILLGCLISGWIPSKFTIGLAFGNSAFLFLTEFIEDLERN